jgi:hypothetical protein
MTFTRTIVITTYFISLIAFHVRRYHFTGFSRFLANLSCGIRQLGDINVTNNGRTDVLSMSRTETIAISALLSPVQTR